jgi:BirA family transcriptional regulator, biotin operon repressor / biotin---[acetyl-CoA-carboxylase] ligase
MLDESAPGNQRAAPLDVERLRRALASAPLYRDLIYLPVSPSTNTDLLERARAGAPEGTLIIADEQPAGRGRVGRVWKTLPRRQILLSLLLRPAFAPHLLVMAASLAVARAVEATTALDPAIKWPNDVLVDGTKVCGILIETSTDARGQPFAVVGIGLNVNGRLADDAELAGRAATLEELAGHPFDRETLAAELLLELADLYQRIAASEDERQTVRAAWRARLETLGREVRILQGEREVHGRAEDVDLDGTLLVRQASGEITPITWGAVS